MTDLNYEQDIEIDPEALDVECLRHATLYYKYSKNEAEAKRNLAEAHENVKVVRSQLLKEAALDPKLKNAAMQEAFYRDHPEHIKAKQGHIEAEYEANMASAAVWSFQTRKLMIENLVKLALSDYFARPIEPRNLKEEAEERTPKNRKPRRRRNNG